MRKSLAVAVLVFTATSLSAQPKPFDSAQGKRVATFDDVMNIKAIQGVTVSPDGKQVIYEKVDYSPRPQNQLLYSWEPDYEYRYTDVFPSFSKDGTLLITNKDADSSIVTMDADGGNKRVVYKAVGGVAFAPSWSPDG